MGRFQRGKSLLSSSLGSSLNVHGSLSRFASTKEILPLHFDFLAKRPHARVQSTIYP
jgi:hypothetical protein